MGRKNIYFVIPVIFAACLPTLSVHATTIDLAVTVRDFHAFHSDMESTIGGLDTGAVMTTLGADGNPRCNTPCMPRRIFYRS